MKKTLIIIFTLTTMFSLFFFGLFAKEPLRYAEGWCTFYYDSHYIADQLSTVGIVPLIKAFLLQFFACPWVGAVVMTVLMLLIEGVALLLFRFISKAKWFSYASLVVPVVSSVLITTWLSGASPFAMKTRQFMHLNNLVRSSDWPTIIDECKASSPVTNLLNQNILNMALAEQDELADELLNEPCADIRSIYQTDISTPQIAALMSDVYYSMGHIAFSQRYAFEANEKMDNMSPRLLQRLVQTNMLYGQYDVARKYLFWLRKTLFYREWADEQYASISQPSQEIVAKRKCIFPDNRFSGIKGLDDDLLNVARSTRGTRQCQTTLLYLGSLYILAGYEDEFVQMIDEFTANGELHRPLPLYFEKYYNHLRKQ